METSYITQSALRYREKLFEGVIPINSHKKYVAGRRLLITTQLILTN